MSRGAAMTGTSTWNCGFQLSLGVHSTAHEACVWRINMFPYMWLIPTAICALSSQSVVLPHTYFFRALLLYVPYRV